MGDLQISLAACYQYTHDLYVGTAPYKDRGIAGIRLDGAAETDLDTYLNAEPEVVTRRKVRSNIAAGAHTVEIHVKGTKNAGSSDYWVYFDFLETACPMACRTRPKPNSALHLMTLRDPRQNLTRNSPYIQTGRAPQSRHADS